jgi:hypothetical protein
MTFQLSTMDENRVTVALVGEDYERFQTGAAFCSASPSHSLLLGFLDVPPIVAALLR